MTTAQVKTINVHDLKTKMDAQADLCLIDVRELEEWQEVHIPKAIHIPKDTIAEGITSAVTDKSQPIYLHCRGGVRSLHAGQTLVNLGYKEVYSVDGGIMEWAQFGYPVTSGE